MTIYYVNPASGLNTNTGLSWGQAWRWLPGNGTAILPGDEIRFAKSEKRTTTISYYGNVTYQLNTSANLASSVATCVSVEAPWSVNSLYATSEYGGCSLLPNKTIPANTKIAWYQFAQHTSSIYKSAYATMRASNVLAAARVQGYRVALCSDGFGDVPVVWLDFGMVPTGTALVNFSASYDAGAIMNLNIISIAIYKGTATEATGTSSASMRLYSYFMLSSTSSWRDIVLEPGSAYYYNTVDSTSPPYDLTTPIMRTITDTYYYISGGLTTLYYQLHPPVQMDIHPNQVIDYYVPHQITTGAELNDQHGLLSFSGTSGAPIRLRGGFDPATDLQDGMTNLNLATSLLYRWGAFCFTNGTGDYLEYENFISQSQPLHSYYQATSAQVTVNSMKLLRCVVGASSYSSRPWCPISVTSANNNFYLAYFKADRSVVGHVFQLVWRGHTNDYQQWGTNALRYGLVELIDTVSGPGGYNYVNYGAANTGLYVGTAIRVIGTAANRAGIAIADSEGNGRAYMNMVSTPWLFEVENAVLFTGGYIARVEEAYYQYVGAVQATASFKNITTSGYYFGLSVSGFKTVTIDGLVSGRSQQYGHLFTVATHQDGTWNNNNPTAGVVVKGSLGTVQAGTSAGITLQFKWLRNIDLSQMVPLDNGNKAPSLTFTACAPSAPIVIENGKYSALVFNYNVTYYTYQAGWYPSATPDTYGFIVRNCHCTVGSSYPAGWVRLEGCTLYGSDSMPAWWSFYSWYGSDQRLVNYAIAGPVLGFGCTLVGNQLDYATYASQTYNSSAIDSTQIGSNRVGMLSGFTATCTYRQPASNTFEYGSNVIEATPSSTITVATGTYNRYPIAVRSTKGWTYKGSGNGLASLSTTMLNTYGAYDITFVNGLFLGRIALSANVNMSLTVVVRSATANIFRMTVSPSREYNTTLSGHVLYRSIRDINTDVTYTLNIAPTGDGSADIFVYAASTMTIRSFTVTTT